MKTTYENCTNKHIVRKFIFEFYLNKYYYENVIGLPGPDINNYIKFCKERGFINLELYEILSEVLYKQLYTLNIKEGNITLSRADIIQAIPNRGGTLYDLDFCRSIRHMSEYLKKFNENFIMTFSLRIGIQETINTFFNIKQEKIINTEIINKPITHTIYSTQNNKYLFVKYFDTSAMCCFAKI